MKKILTLLLLLTFAVAAFAQKNTIKVLAIGNSFSQDAVEQNLYEIAQADGVNLIIGNMYIGGCSLERHYKNSLSDNTDYAYRKIGVDGVKKETKGFTLAQALKDEKWDVITVQQCSDMSGILDSYEPYIGKLITYVRKYTPKKTKIMFHQTWAYETNAVHPSFYKYDFKQDKMYKAVMEASGSVCAKYGIKVIPAGTTIQNIRSTFVIGNVTRDGYHLNHTIGRYAAACTWYEALTGNSPVGNTFVPAHIWEEHRIIAQKAAHEALAHPYVVTDFGYRDLAINYDESKVIPYTLPDPLTCFDGTKVEDAKIWMEKRRPELLESFETEMYGKAPVERPGEMHFEMQEMDRKALGGKATRKQVNIYFDKERKHWLTLLMYIPNKVEGPAPVFLGVNFRGNFTVADDPRIIIPDNLKKYGVYSILPDKLESKRGNDSEGWPLEMILDSGYALATFYRGDIDPDFYDAFGNGIFPLYYRNDQNYPDPDQWGTIRAWAWGLSRSLDYLETDTDVNAARVAVIGHSRLGKTALLAAAEDQRFALAISNDSGCGGAALSRRNVGETVQAINRHFPHWFCANFYKYGEDPSTLPFDQHELIALVAPRPVYVASATEDPWADPKGEYLSAKAASCVYELFGLPGLVSDDMPAPDSPVAEGTIAYHIRTGVHSITPYDWTQYVKFADRYLKPAVLAEDATVAQQVAETPEQVK